jgi:hypothetical protein
VRIARRLLSPFDHTAIQTKMWPWVASLFSQQQNTFSNAPQPLLPGGTSNTTTTILPKPASRHGGDSLRAAGGNSGVATKAKQTRLQRRLAGDAPRRHRESEALSSDLSGRTTTKLHLNNSTNTPLRRPSAAQSTTPLCSAGSPAMPSADIAWSNENETPPQQFSQFAQPPPYCFPGAPTRPLCVAPCVSASVRSAIFRFFYYLFLKRPGARSNSTTTITPIHPCNFANCATYQVTILTSAETHQ